MRVHERTHRHTQNSARGDTRQGEAVPAETVCRRAERKAPVLDAGRQRSWTQRARNAARTTPRE
eukprot:1403151-Rhodomonas_salina.1